MVLKEKLRIGFLLITGIIAQAGPTMVQAGLYFLCKVMPVA
jgi:hypothetical protein